MRHTAFICIAVLLTSRSIQAQNATNNTAAGTRLVEEVKKTGDQIVIPYKRYQLSNGLNVIVHEDHSDPICYVDITYHVGSAREQQGRSGFAHFFEHMMFQGSKHVADEQHFKAITEAGGTLNGSTNTDRTNYFETVPSNQLEKMLWLEADRMGFLLDSVTQRKFEVQRATVKNERGQRYDNAPYGVVGEKIGEALYPQGHPYSWTTIGYIADLDRVDVNDLKRFYMRWYGASNAVLTVAGDVNTDQVVKLAEKYFGNIPAGPSVNLQTAEMVKLDGNRYISYEDQVKFPMLNMAFPTPKLNTPEDAALDALAEVLAGTQSSPLYKGFIETKKAVSATAFQYSRELSGQFQIVIRANPGGKLSDTEKELRRILAEWEKKGVTDDDLVKFKVQFQSNLYNQLSTVQGKGATLASYFTLTGNANYLPEDLARYTSLTKENVMAVYNNYIKNKPAVILSCLPKGQVDLKAAPDTWKMYDRKIETESAEYKNLTYAEPKDNFDRSKMPAAAPAKPVPVPAFYTATLNANIPVIGVTDNEIPKVNLLISFRAGHRFEDRQKAGVAQLLSSMLTRSTLKTSAEEIENRLNRLGSSLDVYTTDDDINVSVQSLSQNLAETMKIVEECLMQPKFDTTEFALEKKKQLDAIMQAQTSAPALADMAFRAVLYGGSNTMGLPVNGNAETVNALTVSDIRSYYEKLNPSMLTVAVTGDAIRGDIANYVSFLGNYKKGGPMKLANQSLPVIDKTRIYFVDKKNAAQSEIRVGYIALPYDALGDFYKAGIMNFAFAGAFNSRVNYLLREVKGWTYGTRGGFQGSHYAGPYVISGGFKANTTDSTLAEIFTELKKYVGGGTTDDEIAFTRSAIQQSDALKYESPWQKLGFIKRVLDYDLPKDYVMQQTAILKAIGKPEINALAKKYLPYDRMAVVVVGDKASNFDKVKKLGYEVIEMDANGKVIN